MMAGFAAVATCLDLASGIMIPPDQGCLRLSAGNGGGPFCRKICYEISGVADLTFARALPRGFLARVKSKTTLET